MTRGLRMSYDESIQAIIMSEKSKRPLRSFSDVFNKNASSFVSKVPDDASSDYF